MSFPHTRISKLFSIEHPLIQAGMVWVSGGKLAAAASNAGCLGIIGGGSMKPDLLRQHIQKAKSLTEKPFGINFPLLYSGIEDQLHVALDEGVKIFFTSAGSPKKFTGFLKQKGAIVVHVTSTPVLAKKCEEAGVDAVVVEGFEAGGHNGRDETTTLVLLQQLKNKLSIPIIAAGGFGSGESIAAGFALGAEGIQIGTAFAATTESSAHQNFKDAMLRAEHNATFLRMKSTVPVRLLNNPFSESIRIAEERCASVVELTEILGKGRAKKGMLDGDLQEGELEIGQIVSEVNEILSCAELVQKFIKEYEQAKKKL